MKKNIIFLSIAIMLMGCSSHKGITTTQSVDSLNHRIRVSRIEESIPSAVAAVRISLPDMLALPAGASYAAESGRSTVRLTKENDSTFTATSTCDSLSRVVLELTDELYRSRNAIEVTEKPPDVKVVKEPNGFQWFQIWIGRLAGLLLVLMLINRRLNIV